MMTGLIQIVIGFAGIVGFFLRFIGPLTIAPTITLMGISLFTEAAESAGKSCRLVNDGAHYCHCANVLRISRFSDFLWVVLIKTGIFLRGLKLCGESRT